MHLFISEYITGGGLAHDLLPENLKQEGLMMLCALVRDCQLIENCKITLTLDSRIDCDFEGVEIITIDTSMDFDQVIQKQALESDKTWIIAPESGEVLADMMTLLEELDVSTINSDAKSVRICANKLQCDTHLSGFGVPTINSLTQDQLRGYHQAVIVKRRDGVGCEGMRKCSSGKAAIEYVNGSGLPSDAWYVQPYVEGKHKSLSLICLNGAAKVLSYNTQMMCFDNTVELISCITNDENITQDIEVLANNIARAIPGLKAYVGVDLIETESARYVIDVNPRLTSSYVGLKQCLVDNPAGMIMHSCNTGALPQLICHLNNKAEVKIVC